jgi:chorismate mutase
MRVRGVRGATTASSNTQEEILQASQELLTEIVNRNGIEIDDVASIFFSTTPDLNTEFPAVAARKLGFTNAALECLVEMNVKGSLQKCIRILMHINTNLSQQEIQHVYLRDAKSLRVDLSEK